MSDGVRKHPMYYRDRPIHRWQVWLWGTIWTAAVLGAYRYDHFFGLFCWSVSIACLFYWLGKDAGRCQFWRYMDDDGRQDWWKYRV